MRAEALEDRLARAVYNVTTTADVVNANDGVLSLREAVLAANASAGVADTINLPAGTYVLTLSGAGEDEGASGDLDVSGNVVIQRAGAPGTVVDATSPIVSSTCRRAPSRWPTWPSATAWSWARASARTRRAEASAASARSA